MPLLSRPKPRGEKVPSDVQDRLRNGREVMLRDASKRRLHTRFERGETYWYLNGKGSLVEQNTVTNANGTGKPAHRIRNKYNFIRPIVEGKISSATQRIPSYEVVPSSTDPEDAAAARLAEKVALYGYDKWMVRRATIKAVRMALVQGEGFVMPVFDTSIGPFIDTLDEETGEVQTVGQGEIRLLFFDGNQVYWQPGCDFYESRWWAIERAMQPEEIQELPGFVGGDLTNDATTHEVATDRRADAVLVTEYLERPCPRYKDGRRMLLANGRVIVPVGAYPRTDNKGRVIDEPVIHRLSYSVEPGQDRDMGLVEQLVDLERTIQDCWNKLLEWKNRCLMPQMTAPKGSNITRPDDVPGSIRYYNVVGGQKPEWERPVPVPQELFQMLNQAIEHMRAIAADVDVQAEPDVAARTAQAAIEQSRARWQSFIGDLAEFHSALMRHLLTIVQQRYTEPRLVKIQGLFGPESIPQFLGADLNGNADVRVSPQSLEVKSRKAIIDEATLLLDRQLISGEAYMATLNGGPAASLARGYELDVAMAHSVIQKIKEGPDSLFSMPTRFDPDVPNPETGTMGMDVPGWLPRRYIDKTDVWIQVMSIWAKTSDFQRIEPGMQAAAYEVINTLIHHKQQEDLEAAQQQQMMAEGLGMANASKPQQAAPTPDQRMPAMPDTPS